MKLNYKTKILTFAVAIFILGVTNQAHAQMCDFTIQLSNNTLYTPIGSPYDIFSGAIALDSKGVRVPLTALVDGKQVNTIDTSAPAIFNVKYIAGPASCSIAAQQTINVLTQDQYAAILNQANAATGKGGFGNGSGGLPQPTQMETISIRSGNSVIWKGVVPLPPQQIMVPMQDSNNNVYQISDQSVLSILQQAQAVSGGVFKISNLQYSKVAPPGFLLKCITAPASMGGELCDNWQYQINNNFSNLPIDQTILRGGEVISFVYGDTQRLFVENSVNNTITINAGDSVNVYLQNLNYFTNNWDNSNNGTIAVLDSGNSTITKYQIGASGVTKITFPYAGRYTLKVLEYPNTPIDVVMVNPVVVIQTGGSTGGSGGGLAANDINKNSTSTDVKATSTNVVIDTASTTKVVSTSTKLVAIVVKSDPVVKKVEPVVFVPTVVNNSTSTTEVVATSTASSTDISQLSASAENADPFDFSKKAGLVVLGVLSLFAAFMLGRYFAKKKQ